MHYLIYFGVWSIVTFYVTEYMVRRYKREYCSSWQWADLRYVRFIWTVIVWCAFAALFLYLLAIEKDLTWL